jgi:hypothetical protein
MKKATSAGRHWLSAADWALVGVFLVVALAVLGFQG